ncbi:MAG: DUF1810 domain-containing protein [Alphaproteobacteria bacterium]
MAKPKFDLERFVTAQSFVYDTALAELRAGRKLTHWMWFVFPQLAALGRSPRAVSYGIGSRAEARAYLDHRLLGPRLVVCTETVSGIEGRSLEEIFGGIDALKFRSSMTLFAAVARDGEPHFRIAIERCCGGKADELTLGLLGKMRA